MTVAAHGAVEALQVAIDHEDEVVEFFARGQGDGAEGFGFIGFAIAEEGPNFGVGHGFQAAIFEVAVVTSLVNGHQRTQAHGDGWKFPEIWHEPGVRIRRKTAAGL